VEIQKAKQDYFKDRSVYYASFPIQGQGKKGSWNYKLAPVYGVGVLDFIFDDHKDDPTLLHTVELKNQRCEVFYDKLKFIYVELPKFNKTVEQLETRFDKWLFLLKHLPDLDNPPPGMDGEVFRLLFEVAELANSMRQLGPCLSVGWSSISYSYRFILECVVIGFLICNSNNLAHTIGFCLKF
jgi:hypothetical protein